MVKKIKIFKKGRQTSRDNWRPLEEPEMVELKVGQSVSVPYGKHYWEFDDCRPCNAPTAKQFKRDK